MVILSKNRESRGERERVLSRERNLKERREKFTRVKKCS